MKGPIVLGPGEKGKVGTALLESGVRAGSRWEKTGGTHVEGRRG